MFRTPRAFVSRDNRVLAVIDHARLIRVNARTAVRPNCGLRIGRGCARVRTYYVLSIRKCNPQTQIASRMTQCQRKLEHEARLTEGHYRNCRSMQT